MIWFTVLAHAEAPIVPSVSQPMAAQSTSSPLPATNPAAAVLATSSGRGGAGGSAGGVRG